MNPLWVTPKRWTTFCFTTEIKTSEYNIPYILVPRSKLDCTVYVDEMIYKVYITTLGKL